MRRRPWRRGDARSRVLHNMESDGDHRDNFRGPVGSRSEQDGGALFPNDLPVWHTWFLGSASGQVCSSWPCGCI